MIGEATKRLSKEFRSQHPTILWQEIAGMRDVISHDYDEIDL
ncbi:MAG: HepT-like ribonuclease domain-containing protein [Phormidesmis sp.]